MKMRTHTCGELRTAHVGETVRLCGWVETVRDHGGVIFIDLRDRYGLTQVIYDPQDSIEAFNIAESTRGEFVLQIEGDVEARPADMVNEKIPTGGIEIRSQEIRILNRSEVPPFPLDDDKAERVSEDLRLEFRYLDLRRKKMLRNLKLRHKLVQAVRNYLDAEEFVDVETPILSKSTPEGARDYLVPSRVVPGSFFALPQAPQQYKQLLMVAGMDRYFQIARCFRDEDLRADRQPEFTQIDIEMSFVTPEDLYQVIDGMMVAILEAAAFPAPVLPIQRMSYADAMNRFGSDKPDLRFGMELTDLGQTFAGTEFKIFAGVLGKGGAVKAINAKGLASVSAGVIDRWTKIAQEGGLGGLAFIRVQDDGTWKSPIVKFFSDEETNGLRETLGIEAGDLVLFGAGDVDIVNPVLGRLRLLAANAGSSIPQGRFAFTWVTEFPLFEKTGDGQLTPMHHPFTSPHPDDISVLDSEPEKVRALAYDLVLNGTEIGGGSIRIHDHEVQTRIFNLLRMPADEIEGRFGHLIRALTFGAPPHGGIAFGLDRIAMLMAGGESIREVIAFPKTQKAMDLMMGAPSTVDDQQLQDVYLRMELPDEPG